VSTAQTAVEEPDAPRRELSLPSAIQPFAMQLPLPRRVAAFGFLLAAEFFYSWAWNTVDILRPFIRESLGLTLTQAGSAYSAQGAGALLGSVMIGQLADRLGRRNMLVAVMLGYGTMLLAGVAVSSYPELLLQRFALGIFLGGSFPVVVGIYVGLFEPGIRGRLASLVSAVFSASIITQGFAFGHLGGRDWHLLIWLGGVPPILLAFFAYAIVPGSIRQAVTEVKRRLPIREPAVRRQTLLLASLTGLNFFAYQAFSGWLTIYLKDVRHLPALVTGHLIAAQFAGNLLGCFFWGWVGDRFGRRASAVGFFIAAAAIGVFLTAPASPLMLISVGFLYGFCLSASVVWGPWLAELYPEHLRSTAASIFNWGRLISFFAPLITGAMAGRLGLRISMLTSSLAFCLAGIIWLSLPETLRRKNRAS